LAPAKPLIVDRLEVSDRKFRPPGKEQLPPVTAGCHTISDLSLNVGKILVPVSAKLFRDFRVHPLTWLRHVF
jgi:hypothetical protein